MTRRAEWEERVRQWRASGAPLSEFCAERSIKPKLLQWWASQLRREARDQPSTARGVVKMARVVPVPENRGHVVVELRGARVLVSRETDRVALAMVLDLLGGRA